MSTQEGTQSRLSQLAQRARAEFADIVAADPWRDLSTVRALLSRVVLELSVLVDAEEGARSPALAELLEAAEWLAEWEVDGSDDDDDDDGEGDPEARLADFWNEVDGFIESLADAARLPPLTARG